jgi:hypothetical protein
MESAASLLSYVNKYTSPCITNTFQKLRKMWQELLHFVKMDFEKNAKTK